MRRRAQPPPQATQGPIAAPATSEPALEPGDGDRFGGQPPEAKDQPPYGGDGGEPIPPVPTGPETGLAFRRGDFVFDPYTYGMDQIFQVVQGGPKVTFVVGGLFEEPTPVLTADLQSLQDSIEPNDPAGTTGLPAVPASRVITAVRKHVIRTTHIRTANDEGILRLQMLQEGIGRIGPSLAELGIAGAGILLTYTALKGLVDKLLRERVQSKEQRRDYDYENNDLLFSYL